MIGLHINEIKCIFLNLDGNERSRPVYLKRDVKVDPVVDPPLSIVVAREVEETYLVETHCFLLHLVSKLPASQLWG